MICESKQRELLERYDSVGSFSEGLAIVYEGGSIFHVYPNGKQAYEERYYQVSDFHEGLAGAGKDGERFHIRHDGTRVD